MGYEDFYVVKVALTVVAPWPGQDLLHVWVTALLFRHIRTEMVMMWYGCSR